LLDADCFDHDVCYAQSGLEAWMNFDPFLSSSKQLALFKCNQALCTAAAKLTSAHAALVVDFFQAVPIGTCAGGLPSTIFHSIHPLAKSSVPVGDPISDRILPSAYDRWPDHEAMADGEISTATIVLWIGA
jgi:hypothetical protein